MKNIPLAELITSLILIIILFLFIAPTSLSMPASLGPMLTVFLILAFLVFAALIWKEQSADERENLHRLNAGRVSFLFGSAVLVLGILIQSLSHNVDPWLIYTLVTMILVKIISRIYSEKTK